MSLAGDGDTLRLAFFEFLVAGLHPEAGSLGQDSVWIKNEGQ